MSSFPPSSTASTTTASGWRPCPPTCGEDSTGGWTSSGSGSQPRTGPGGRGQKIFYILTVFSQFIQIHCNFPYCNYNQISLNFWQWAKHHCNQEPFLLPCETVPLMHNLICQYLTYIFVLAETRLTQWRHLLLLAVYSLLTGTCCYSAKCIPHFLYTCLINIYQNLISFY